MKRPHWSLCGWYRVKDPTRLLRHRDVPGAHVAEVYRVVRIGPWSLMAFRYRRGPSGDPGT